MNDDILAELEAMSLESAHAEEVAGNRPQWAQEQFPVTRVSGRITSITKNTRYTKNGTAIPEYQLHIAKPFNVEGVYDGGEVVLPVVEPKKGSRRGTQQPFYWLLASAMEQGCVMSEERKADPKKEFGFVDLLPYDLTFQLDARKPWPTAMNEDFYYKVTERLSDGAEKPAAPEPTTVSMPLLHAACAFAVEAGLTPETVSGSSIMKDPSVQAASSGPMDIAALGVLVVRKTLFNEGVAAGMLTTSDDGWVLRQPALPVA